MGMDRMRTRGVIAWMCLSLIVTSCAPSTADPIARASASPTASPLASRAPATLTPPAPEVTLDAPRDARQAPRYVAGRWTATQPVTAARAWISPAQPFECDATVDQTAKGGTYGCRGLLPAGLDARLEVQVTSAAGATGHATLAIHTMGERLAGVPWYTEFEDPAGEPLACAAASVRIVQSFTTGRDVATAERILALGQRLNRSADPGLDPAAIAGIIAMLEPANHYHYYRSTSREDATRSAVYWLVRSGKPVIVISLAGQHAPVLVGYAGTFGTHYGDPVNRITGVVVEDPQRGDLQRATQSRRPDKPRSAEFQTGRLLGLDEWYSDEWWLGYPYQGVIRMPDGSFRNVERNDGVYPAPHWHGTFVFLADDGDAEWPSDREGRVRFR